MKFRPSTLKRDTSRAPVRGRPAARASAAGRTLIRALTTVAQRVTTLESRLQALQYMQARARFRASQRRQNAHIYRALDREYEQNQERLMLAERVMGELRSSQADVNGPALASLAAEAVAALAGVPTLEEAMAGEEIKEGVTLNPFKTPSQPRGGAHKRDREDDDEDRGAPRKELFRS